MSGGHFEYKQDQLRYLKEDILILLERNDYPPEIAEKFREAVSSLNESYIYLQRIDWLLCGDDGDDGFLRRLKEDLENAKRLETDHA